MEAVLQDASVLVLNRLWQAVTVCSCRRAFRLLYAGRAKVIAAEKDGVFNTYSFEDWRDLSRLQTCGTDCLRTVSFAVRIPRIILLLFYDKQPIRQVKFTRRNIFDRDRSTCQYCGKRFEKRELNIDHVVPLSRGGGNTWENVVCCCVPCNIRKGNRLPAEAGMRLIRLPKRPRWHPFLRVPSRDSAYSSWKAFLDQAYWNVDLAEERTDDA